MRWIDTHCHLDAPEFDADRADVIARARAAGVTRMVLPAVEVANFDAVRALAHAHGLAYALGIHPLYVDRAADDDLDRLRDALAAHRDDPRLVAVGEIGLDHFVPGLDRDTAGALLRRAAEAGARVRPAGDPARAPLGRRSAQAPAPHRGAAAASPTRSTAASSRRRPSSTCGFKLGFGGAMTFERALQIRRLAQTLPETALGARDRRARHPAAVAVPQRRGARARRDARATSRPSCRASPPRWPRCAAGRSSRRPRVTAANALRRAAAAGSAAAPAPRSDAPMNDRLAACRR